MINKRGGGGILKKKHFLEHPFLQNFINILGLDFFFLSEKRRYKFSLKIRRLFFYFFVLPFPAFVPVLLVSFHSRIDLILTLPEKNLCIILTTTKIKPQTYFKVEK